MKRPQLTRQVVLEERAQVPDGAGGFSETWEALGTLWADIRHRTGRQSRSRPAVSVSLTPYRILVRSAPVGSASRPKPEQRFREGLRVFRILAVAEADAEGRYLTCFAEEEVAG